MQPYYNFSPTNNHQLKAFEGWTHPKVLLEKGLRKLEQGLSTSLKKGSFLPSPLACKCLDCCQNKGPPRPHALLLRLDEGFQIKWDANITSSLLWPIYKTRPYFWVLMSFQNFKIDKLFIQRSNPDSFQKEEESYKLYRVVSRCLKYTVVQKISKSPGQITRQMKWINFTEFFFFLYIFIITFWKC